MKDSTLDAAASESGPEYIADLRRRLAKALEDQRKVFAIRVVSAREQAGLSQRQLAKLMGVSHVAVGGWERAQRMPSDESLKEAADLCGVSREWMLTGRLAPISEGVLIALQKLPEMGRATILALLTTLSGGEE